MSGWPTTIKRTSKAKQRRCSLCGELGHNRDSHLQELPSKKCARCHTVKPVGEFGEMKHRVLNGKVVIKRYASCRSCVGSRSAERRAAWTITDRLAYVLIRCRVWSRARGVVCDISVPWLEALVKKQSGLCHYSGRPLMAATGPDCASIDRVDSRKGYTRENVVISRWIVNSMKNSFTVEQFIDECQAVVGHSERNCGQSN